MEKGVNEYQDFSAPQKETTIKDLFLKFGGYFNEVKSKWKTILLLSTVLAIIGLAYALLSKPLYVAKVNFLQYDAKSSRLGGLSSLIGGLGIADASASDLYKIIEVAKSRSLLEKTLFEKIKVRNKSDYIANHIIDVENLHENQWKSAWYKPKDPLDLSAFYFTHAKVDSFNRLELKALKSLYTYIIGTEEIPANMVTFSADEISTIMELIVKSKNDTVAIELARRHFNNLNNKYTFASAEKQRNILDVFEFKIDSIKSLLNRKDYAYGNFQDRVNNFMFAKDKVPLEQYGRDKQILSAGLVEVMKNYELADFNYRNELPYIQSIDLPIGPLDPNTPSPIKMAFAGFFLGIVLTAFYYVFRKLWNETMQAEA